MSFIVSAASNYILNDGLGDWSSLVTTPTNFTGTACLYYSTCLMANISRVLGRSDDADKYDTLAGKRSSSHTQIFSLISFFFFFANFISRAAAAVREAFNAAFLETSTGRYLSAAFNQYTQSTALWLGLVPSDLVYFSPSFGVLFFRRR